MTDPETANQPLLTAPTAVSAQSGRSSRAYKVAGITLLACVLIVGQAMIAYFLLSQRSDIKALKEQNDNLKSEMTKGRSVSVPVRMHMPMNALSDVMDVALVDSTKAPRKSVPLTDCQKEAAGLMRMEVPGFKPDCDEHGLYLAQQCFARLCWCVNPSTGKGIPGTQTNKGRANCDGAKEKSAVPYGMNQLFHLPDIKA